MSFYGLMSGGSTILLKLGILRVGGLAIHNFWSDLIPAASKLLTDRVWMTGAFLSVGGFLVYLVALQFFDLSIVKPLVNTNLLVSVVIAFIILNERLRFSEWLGVLVLVCGVLLIATSPTGSSSTNVTFTDLLSVVPLSLVLILALVTFTAKPVQNHAEVYFSIFSGLFYGLGTIYTKGMVEALPNIGLFVLSLTLFLANYGVAIVAGQLAFERGRLSIINPLVNGLSVSTAVVGAVLIFGEPLLVTSGLHPLLSLGKLVGLICILVSLVLLRRELPIQNNSILDP